MCVCLCVCVSVCMCVWYQGGAVSQDSILALLIVKCISDILVEDSPSRLYPKEIIRDAYQDSMRFFTALFVSQKLESTTVSGVILESAANEGYNETGKFFLSLLMFFFRILEQLSSPGSPDKHRLSFPDSAEHHLLDGVFSDPSCPRWMCCLSPL